jgi:hypothetical protein
VGLEEGLLFKMEILTQKQKHPNFD